MKAIAILMFSVALTAGAQNPKPVVVQVPVTQPRHVCPKNYTLWAQNQEGTIPVKGAEGTGLVEPTYGAWFKWDGFGYAYKGMTNIGCFKRDPNVPAAPKH